MPGKYYSYTFVYSRCSTWLVLSSMYMYSGYVHWVHRFYLHRNTRTVVFFRCAFSGKSIAAYTKTLRQINCRLQNVAFLFALRFFSPLSLVPHTEFSTRLKYSIKVFELVSFFSGIVYRSRISTTACCQRYRRPKVNTF